MLASDQLAKGYMVSTLNTKSLSIQMQNLLDRLDKRFFKQAMNVDGKTFSFYTFKAYPKSLSKQVREDWARIQAKALSPYENGEVQYYLCDSGVAIWACAGKFDGVPETRAQNRLSDGSYIVKGQVHNYKQVWTHGVLSQCYIVDSKSACDVTLNTQTNPWAIERQIDALLTSPKYWASAIGLILATVFVWFVVAKATIFASVSALEDEIAASELAMGDVLTQQVELQSKADVLEQINQWRHRFLPLQVVVGEVVKSVSEQTVWNAASIEWQSNTLVTELTSSDIDIASLVQVLENNALINKAAVRPHARENTWVLEVTFNENAFSQR
ncbi:hypothetical protein D210916BOD24_27230 [Alteromonas sp. D210916BOD_24]|uniref:hypothetical protein n=1 Tax=Alteromonas sp. D210916BOD_24 TaxID=3157618 RepID=UPI00399C4E4D